MSEHDNDQSVYFDLKLPDDKLVDNLIDAIDESQAWWNSKKGMNLAEVRKKNVEMWLPKYESADRYEYQKANEYKDPRIFVSTETILATVAGRLPTPDVYPASKTETSMRLAHDLHDGIQAWAEEHQLLDTLRGALRNNVLKRIGFVYLKFDPDYGKNGDIVPELVDPEDIVVDRYARKGDNPRFIARKRTMSVDDWVAMWPEAKSKIYKAMDIRRGVASQRSQRAPGWEVWFTYHDESGKAQEAVAWFIKRTLIAKIQHPHWIPDDEMMTDEDVNVIGYPEKPFFALNNLNLGKHYIDDTTLLEQAESIQRILDRRGTQLSQNADDASGGLVLNAGMIDSDDAEKLIGDPQEKIMVDGDVRAAVTRIAPAILPGYVLEDKYDARSEIDNIFATHAPLRGEKSTAKTLGQDVLQQQQDMTRHDDLVRSLEFMATKLFRYVVQMMKVHYTEEHMFRMSGENGTFNFITLKADDIEDGIDVRVKSGSTLPLDKASLRQQTIELSQAGLIDPLTLYETLNFPEPQKMVERLINYKQDPVSFVRDYKDDNYEREAFANIQIINRGMEPNEVKEPSAQYINYYKEYMVSGEFMELPDEVKLAHMQHIQEVTAKLQELTALRETQMPTEEEIEAANQKEMQMQQMMQQAMGGGSGGGSPEIAALTQRTQLEPMV